ncbi:Utp4p [Sugiyamaella lignohabitans]|uniref:Utp4p n=1 Tax=Sugiyamaella lignohabitans TaxID=796027 RepID=A0A167FAR2_9ASCO|nr:Utp4p [Sugiyamaella lignohabitans]ANB15042.1 Utp4p [Sugiyamaella lignohabitans]
MNIHRCRFVDYTPHTITALSFNLPSVASNIQPPSTLRLAVGRSNGDIEIWNPRWSWVHEITLKGGQGRSIEGLVWSKGGNRLFSIGGSTSITEWDLNTGLPVLSHDCNAGVVWSLAISPDGEQLAAGCDNGTVVLLDLSSGIKGQIDHLKILQRSNNRIMSLAWKGANQVVGGCSDGRIRVWSTESSNNGRILATMKVDKSRLDESTLVWSVLVLPNKQIVSGDSTGSIKFWDAQNFSLLQSFKSHEADILCLASNYKGNTIFSAGVDRKIVSYKIVNSKLKRWASVSNRLLHAHDIRAMTTFEAKGTSFLISGGVERTLVINSVTNFMDGMFRKIPITRHRPCVQAISEPRLLMLWNDQSVKIWKVDEYIEPDAESLQSEEKGKRLVAKITLNCEENVTSAALSENGSLLAVSTLAETKLFELTPSENGSRLLVQKSNEANALSSLGASIIRFSQDSSKLIAVTPESDIVVYNVANDELIEESSVNDSDDEDDEQNFHAASSRNIFRLSVSNCGKYVATARPNGQINLFEITKTQVRPLGLLTKLNSAPTALKFTLKNTLIIATAEIKVLEFDINTKSLTPWSRRNSDLLPRDLINLVDKCCGIFFEPCSPNRVWLWGANWLAFLDLAQNMPFQRVAKRKIDRLGVDEEEDRATTQEIRKSLPLNGHDVNGTADNASTSVPFWMTLKYRPMLLADTLGAGELVVIERPPFDVPLPPAFWSNHKIKV